MKTTLKLLLVFLFAGICLNLMAQGIVTDRPSQSESSLTVPRRSLQIETGVNFSFLGSGDARSKNFIIPASSFRIGLTNWLELRLLSQVKIMKLEGSTTTGIGDPEIGLKFQLLRKENSGTSLALITHLAIPTGTEGLGGENFGTIVKLAASHNIAESFGIGYNLGYSYFGEGNGNLIYSLLFGFSITEKLGVYVEPYGELTGFEEFVVNADAGMTYLVLPNLQLDFSFATGLNNEMNYVAFGLGWRIP